MATQPNLITLSDKGSEFIRNFEGFREFPYLDTGGIATIGYGTTLDAGGVVKYKDGIAKDHALALFNADVSKIIAQLAKCPFNGFQEWQFDAIISLSYNIGYGAFSTSTVYKQLMVRNTDLGSWLWFCKDNKGHVDMGLGRRRRMELKLFVYGLYS
jgi:lysozyme